VELNSRNLASRCESCDSGASGADESEVKLVQGCDRGYDRFGTGRGFVSKVT